MGILMEFVGMMRRRILGGYESCRCAVCQNEIRLD
jgi:hypothetical protein